MTILQAPDIWGALMNHGILFVILGLAVYTLWQRDNSMAEDRKKALSELSARLEKYLAEDRNEMISVIKSNTQAFEDLRETLKEIANKK